MTESARFAALAAAVLFSTGGAAVKVAAFSAAQVFGCDPGSRHSCCCSGIGATGVDAVDRPAAIVYAATLTLFVAATRLTTAANAIFLQSTAPLDPSAAVTTDTRRARFSTGRRIPRHHRFRHDAVLPGSDPRHHDGTQSCHWKSARCRFRGVLGVDVGRAPVSQSRDPRTGSTGYGGPGITAVVAGNALAFLVALPWMFPTSRACRWSG